MTTQNDCPQISDPLRLIREGTSQDQRLLPELKPEHAPADQRKTEHAMVFAKAYARLLKFYGPSGNVVGDWEAFFSQDVSVLMAIASVQDIDFYKSTIKASFDFLNNHENKDKTPELKSHLGYLFNYVGTLAKQLDSLKNGLPDGNALKSTLQNLIQNQLASNFTRLISYYNADNLIAIADGAPSDIVILGETPAAFGNILTHNFSKEWITDNAADWASYTATIKPDDSVYGSGISPLERINHIANHNLFTAIFDQFLKVFARTVIGAKAQLEMTFTGYDRHEPHYALFLAFLRLFEQARNETNTLTKRHLDFYYQDILRLKEKPAEPCHAHLLVGLAKHVDSHDIKADELFKAGKDASGKEAYFANDLDFVVNQAKVTALKTFYHHKNSSEKNSLPGQNNRLFASLKADSADGLEAKITTADQSWHCFFNKTYENGQLSNINMPPAEVGFAVASHYLLMAEGTRTVTMTFTLKGTAPAFDCTNNAVCLVTTEKGWFKAKVSQFAPPSQPTNTLKLDIQLDGLAPPITPYLAKTHGYGFATDLPVLVLKLVHDDSAEFPYAALQPINLSKIELEVKVENLKTLAVSNNFGPVDASKPFQPFGASPAKDSSLIIGCKEAFQKNLSKCAINITWQSAPAPHVDQAPQIDIGFLQAAQWTDITPGFDISKLAQPTTSFDLGKATGTLVDSPDFSVQELFNTASRHGFVRFKLSGDFGQGQYEQEMIDYITAVAFVNTKAGKDFIKQIADDTIKIKDNLDNIGTYNKDIKSKLTLAHNYNDEIRSLINSSNADQATKDEIKNDTDALDTTLGPNLFNNGPSISKILGSANDSLSTIYGQNTDIKTHLNGLQNKTELIKPTLPVGPYITQLTLDYTAKQTLNPDTDKQVEFDLRPGHFFHLGPFGHAEQHAVLKAGLNDPGLYLLPQFQHTDKTEGRTVIHEAQFYIGITGLKPPQNLALLFQVADGTANPLTIKPEPHIHWSYLSNNEWLDFGRLDVQDHTGGLLNSGIITFSISDKATSANTILPAGHYWLRAAVEDKADAVCRLIAVLAQGLSVTFQDHGNDPAFLAKTLPAGTINKLDQPDAAVKQVSQPFESFGGRPVEGPLAFYTRVSERLRHKDRAIALWDYEHLILEAFPQIYKAKCLNHTNYEPSESGDGIYLELAPGHITIVTIPNRQSHDQQDPLRPYTSLGLLKEIQAFLQKRLSCFIRLHVNNPQFEEVSAQFNVRLREGLDETFYATKLQQAITRFLSPWAFPDGGHPSFEGKIHQSVLINFVEEQPYVDYVTDFLLFHHLIIEGKTQKIPKSEIEGCKAVSILVSVPASQHNITIIKTADASAPGENCPCAA